MQAHCYAEPGNTVEDDMEDQLGAFFEQFPAKRDPKVKPSLDPDSTLYGVPSFVRVIVHINPYLISSRVVGNK